MRRETGNDHGITYAASGVDIDAAGKAVDRIKEKARATFRPEVLTDIGAFAGLFQLSDYQEPVLVSSVDGVGTKVKIAIALDRHNTIGIDLVNHCVNDIFTCGAEPLFFLDYLAAGKLIPEQVESIVTGLAHACSDVGCALIGGETAEMPGLYAPSDYDLAGFIVGVVEKGRIIDNSAIEAGDSILGLPSSGLHTNGYSLVRKIFNLDEGGPEVLGVYYPELGRTLGEELLESHRCYYSMVKPILDRESGCGLRKRTEQKIKGLAHITGGGLVDNVARILLSGVTALFCSDMWEIPPIFRLIQKQGGVEREEMFHVFNMGIGMALFCSPSYVEGIISEIPDAKVIGDVVEWRDGTRVAII